MVRTYALGHKGMSFTGRLLNINDPANPIDKDMRDTMTVYCKFFQPRGETFLKEGVISDDNPDLSDGADIVYRHDTSAESILDQRGPWKYTVAAKFDDGRYVESPYREVFWVV